MQSSTRRRALALESLEFRITPAVLGLTLPGPLTELAGRLESAVPVLSSLPVLSSALAPPPAGHTGLGLGVDLGILSIGVGVGSKAGLLSLGVTLDPPLVPPLSVQAGVGSPQGAISVGVTLPPSAPSSPPGVDPGGVPPATPPPTPPAPPPKAPPISTPVTLGSSVVLPPAATPPVTPAQDVAAEGTDSFTDIGVTNQRGPVGDGPSSTPFPSPRANDVTFVSFSSLPTRPNDIPSQRAEPSADDFEGELFRLRDGRLLEDFGAAIAAEDAGVSSFIGGDTPQAENDNAMALWLAGLLAGCVAGSAWLTTQREQESAPVEFDPSPIPVG